jgi:hypothetical protein
MSVSVLRRSFILSISSTSETQRSEGSRHTCLAFQVIGLMLPCNCIPVQTGIRDMGTREMQLLQYTAKCFLYLLVPRSSSCSVTDIYTLCRTFADSS